MSGQRSKWSRLLFCSSGALVLGLAGLSGCSAGDDPAPSSPGSNGFSGGTSGGTSGGDSADFGSRADIGDGNFSAEPPALPEEIEELFDFRAPVSTGKYLWSTNPESGRVALIDVEEVTVDVLNAGLEPTFLASVPNESVAAETLVLNLGSSDATRFLVTEGDDGRSVAKERVETHEGANRISVSSTGKFAVAWSGPEQGQVADPTEGYQEITVIRLGEEQARSTRLTIGFRPSQVVVSSDDARLVVVSEEGMTVIDLTAEVPTPLHFIELGLDEETRDVSINTAASHALVRRAGQSAVDVFDLAEPDSMSQVEFGAAVTDVDLASDDRGVAVIRSESTLHAFDLNELLLDPTDYKSLTIDGELFGSAELSETGNQAVLYTNAAANERISVVDLTPSDEAMTFKTLSTSQPVFSVTLTPDGLHAVVMSADDGGSRSDIFSIVALTESRFPRIVGTSAPLAHVALGNSFGVVTSASEDSSVYEAHLISMPQLSVKTLELAGDPLSAGMISTGETNLAYVAQAHAEGRVTFYDFAADRARTLTGFELSAEVVDE